MQRAQDTTVRERRSALLNDASLSEEERDARLGQLLTNYAVPNDSELEALLQQEQDILQELDRRGEGPEEPQAGPQAGEQAGEQAAVQAEAEPAEAPVQPEAGPRCLSLRHARMLSVGMQYTNQVISATIDVECSSS